MLSLEVTLHEQSAELSQEHLHLLTLVLLQSECTISSRCSAVPSPHPRTLHASTGHQGLRDTLRERQHGSFQTHSLSSSFACALVATFFACVELQFVLASQRGNLISVPALQLGLVRGSALALQLQLLGKAEKSRPPRLKSVCDLGFTSLRILFSATAASKA